MTGSELQHVLRVKVGAALNGQNREQAFERKNSEAASDRRPPPLAPDSGSSGLLGDHLLAAYLIQHISQCLCNRVHAGPSPVGASDTGQSLDRLLGA